MTEAPLPDPKELKNLMSAASDRVIDILFRLRTMAADYGVHGTPMMIGELSFQLTRVHEKWSIYVASPDASLRDLEGVRVDEKILFLEHAEEFEADYCRRIVDLYGKLKRVVSDGA